MKEDKKRRNAVARILGAENKGQAVIAEAKRAGKHPRTVERWMEGTEAAVSGAGQDAVPENAAPPVNGAGNTENPALKAALDAAGTPEAGPKKDPVTEKDVVDARLDIQKFCLDTIGNVTQAIGSVIVTSRYSPPLLLSDQAVQKLLELSMLEAGIIKANAETLYPILVKWMAGPYQLAGGLIFGQVLRWVGIDNLAKNRGWKEAPKAAPTFAAAPPPPPSAPRATAPAWAPPSEGIQAEDRTSGPYGKISDAPSVESPHILPADPVAA